MSVAVLLLGNKSRQMYFNLLERRNAGSMWSFFETTNEKLVRLSSLRYETFLIFYCESEFVIAIYNRCGQIERLGQHGTN